MVFPVRCLKVFFYYLEPVWHCVHLVGKRKLVSLLLVNGLCNASMVRLLFLLVSLVGSVLWWWFFLDILYMSQHMTKPTKWLVRPAKTQIRLGIRPVWPETSVSTWRKVGPLATHWVHSEDTDQTGRMPRLIWVFAVRICYFVGFVMRRFIVCYCINPSLCA